MASNKLLRNLRATEEDYDDMGEYAAANAIHFVIFGLLPPQRTHLFQLVVARPKQTAVAYAAVLNKAPRVTLAELRELRLLGMITGSDYHEHTDLETTWRPRPVDYKGSQSLPDWMHKLSRA